MFSCLPSGASFIISLVVRIRIGSGVENLGLKTKMLFKSAESTGEGGTTKSKLPLRMPTVRRKKPARPTTAVAEDALIQEENAEELPPLLPAKHEASTNLPTSTESQQGNNGAGLTHKASKLKTMLDFFKGKK